MNSPQGSAPTFNSQQAAQDQTRSNFSTAAGSSALKNVNQVTPYGNLTYGITGSYTDPTTGASVPTYTATQTLSPGEQGLLDSRTSLQQGSLDQAKTLQGQITDELKNPAPDSQAFTDKAYGDLMGRFNTDYDRTQTQLDTKLKNQGIQPGTEAYNTQMDLLSRTKTDAQQQAELNATDLAGKQQSQYQSAQKFPITEYSSLYGLGSDVTNPSLTSTPQTDIQSTDVAGLDLAAYQGQLNAYNQANTNSNSTMGALFGLGGSTLGGVLSNPAFSKWALAGLG